MNTEVRDKDLARLKRSIARLETEFKLNAPDIIIKNELEIIKKLTDQLSKNILKSEK